MRPEVTVGICIKDAENTIQDAINSVLEQTYNEFMELIVVDGCSRDNTLDSVRNALRGSGVGSRLFLEDKGLGYARQIVVDKAKGDYIVWVDGDMTLSRNYVEELVTFMRKHPEVGVAKGRQSPKGGNLLATLEACSRAMGRFGVDRQSDKARLRPLGTSGSMYRVDAIRQAGGFDENLKGYGEDFDVELRIRSAGWSFRQIEVEYSDYERYKLTWSELWRRYWLRGYYNHFFFHKNTGLMKHYRMFPPAAFVNGILHSHKLFGLTKQKSVFFLPFQYLFKMSAWYAGFIRSHLDIYEPKPSC